MTSSSIERAAALAALVAGTTGDEGSAAPHLERTGREVYAGGDERRLLIQRASTLGYVTGGVYQRAGAVPGDVITVTKAQAKRLDELGVTVDPDADLDEVEAEVAEGKLTDEQIKTARAEELIAYVGQHPDERERVKALEETRKASAQRSSVLAACEPTPEEDEAAQAEADARNEGSDDAEAQAEAQQDNDGGATGE